MPQIPNRTRTTETLYLGIDPGSSNGGIALIRPTSLRGLQDVECWSIPQTEQDLWRLIKTVTVDPFSLRSNSSRVNVKAVIEWVHPAIQGIGKSAQSKLYGNYMACRMALTAAEIPFEDCMAAKWQAALSIPKRSKAENQNKWKDRLRGAAQRLYPKLPAWTETLKVQREVCDAVLIATYCLRKHTGTL